MKPHLWIDAGVCALFMVGCIYLATQAISPGATVIWGLVAGGFGLLSRHYVGRALKELGKR